MPIKFHEIRPDALADSYADDPRVTTNADKSSYIIQHPKAKKWRSFGETEGGYFTLWHNGVFGWTLSEGPNLEFVQLPKGQGVTDADFAIGYDTAGKIINALIGPPRRR